MKLFKSLCDQLTVNEALTKKGKNLHCKINKSTPGRRYFRFNIKKLHGTEKSKNLY